MNNTDFTFVTLRDRGMNIRVAGIMVSSHYRSKKTSQALMEVRKPQHN